MRVLAIAVGHIIFEFSAIHVTLSVPESALTFSFIEIPLALVVGTIGPVLDSVSMPELLDVRIVFLRPIDVVPLVHHPIALLRRVVTSRYFHFHILIPLFHLTPIYGIIWINKHISVNEAGFVAEFRKELFIRLHLHLVVASH